MALDVRVVAIRPGGAYSVDLTDRLDGQPTFATAAVGGFADCTLSLHGDARRDVPYLSKIVITYGYDTLYEGQVEDADPSGSGSDLKTTVTCFGLRNLLTEVSTRRIWSKRDLGWTDPSPGVGRGSWLNALTKSTTLALNIGQFDPTDLTKTGLSILGLGSAVSANFGNFADLNGIPNGLSLIRLMATLVLSGANTGAGKIVGTIASSSDKSTWTSTDYTAASNTVSQSLVANTAYVRVGAYNVSAGSLTPATSEHVDIYDIRVLGTSLTEDAPGGFYGGTILRDLIALVPGLTAGVIEDGSDFTIQAVERAVRDQALAVVEEVTGYYTREWAVWENGRFDWKTRSLDSPDWIVTLGDLSSLSLDGTLDGIARTVYVLYTDAASGLDAEASAAATSQRNPYVKQGRAKDLLVRAGFPMTSNTSAQLAARLAGDIGQWVPVQGTITLPATKLIGRATGSGGPAMLIRGGDNLLIGDLPKTDLFQQGRDGETLFHIVGTSCDLQAGTVTLELEGQSRRTDILLARLAAVTRTLTGS